MEMVGIALVSVGALVVVIGCILMVKCALEGTAVLAPIGIMMIVLTLVTVVPGKAIYSGSVKNDVLENKEENAEEYEEEIEKALISLEGELYSMSYVEVDENGVQEQKTIEVKKENVTVYEGEVYELRYKRLNEEELEKMDHWMVNKEVLKDEKEARVLTGGKWDVHVKIPEKELNE